ncbi:hypothetical protein C7S20_15135 [Christiangramia fulva]|uniref:Uncharacterized protein n=1 Tax=Christiangramia fulva TaxID=2126553 RepID=A0A2R3Z876_9FLAO|nr:DUF6520 family protein [Christiangramia fulva]AVR46490.1 hypothetical protein C7S20_15135 [Christiangramia fulva]
MKKLFLIPIMALLVVFGMSFTINGSKIEEQPDEAVASDYILFNGSWRAIDEQDCPGTGNTCKVKFTQNGTEYAVYDEMDDTLPKDSASEEAVLIDP